MPKHDFTGRHVLITGASSGIGRALAIAFAKVGAKVGLLARREEMLQSLLEDVRGLGATGAIAPADVCDGPALEAALASLEDALGPTYALIANAGIEGLSRGGVLDVEKAHRCLDVNLLGVIRTIGALQAGFHARGEGIIATVSSLAAYRGLPGAGPYCASKAGLSALTESLRLDLRSRGISVTTIHPGFVKTPLTERAKSPQPFLMDVEPAAELIVRRLRRGPREINFPWQLALIMRAVRRFPNVIYDWALKGRGA